MNSNSTAIDDSEPDFAAALLHWFDRHGRHDLPWQQDPTPYRVWISEIMLQQTQVATVIPYYERFMVRFPTVLSLAQADLDQVLHLWTGLGYYARARNLHEAAQRVSAEFDGEFPGSLDALESLPGIGRSTAGAIAALAMDQRAPILDGNVKRVLTRRFAIEGWPEQASVKSRLWQLAERLTPAARSADYTQAIMDLGATVCTRNRPACESCPLATDCLALEQGLIDQLPGKKPRKTLPIKTVRMLIVQNGRDEVLLEKRPSQGIWGGLYSLPETALDSDSEKPATEPSDWPLQAFQAGGGATPAPRDLEPIRHSFSHYHLDISPRLILIDQTTGAVADSDRWLWYPLDHSLEVGLAAPVKKLLSRLAPASTENA